MDQGIVTLLTGLGVVAAQIYRESRQRKWREQDRLRVDAERRAENVALAAKVSADAAGLAAKVSADHAALAATVVVEQERAVASRRAIESALVENTTLTRAAADAAHAAFKEANDVNAKIEKLGIERRR